MDVLVGVWMCWWVCECASGCVDVLVRVWIWWVCGCAGVCVYVVIGVVV